METNGGFRGEIPLSRFPIIAWGGIGAHTAPRTGEGAPPQGRASCPGPAAVGPSWPSTWWRRHSTW
jgi:hypothetical protein